MFRVLKCFSALGMAVMVSVGISHEITIYIYIYTNEYVYVCVCIHIYIYITIMVIKTRRIQRFHICALKFGKGFGYILRYFYLETLRQCY